MTENEDDILRTLGEFNKRVVDTYLLDNKNIKMTDKDWEIQGRFMFLASVTDTFFIAKASAYDYKNMPEDLTISLAESFAEMQIAHADELEIKALLPDLKSQRHQVMLEEKAPHIWSLYQQLD